MPAPAGWALLRRACMALAIGMALAGCATPVPPACGPDAGPPDDVVYVVAQGWHTEIGVPDAALLGPMAMFRRVFPGLRTLMLGFGKRTFITAKVETLSELMLGPVPGPGAIEATGLNTTPDQAFPQDTVLRLRLPPGGAAGLARFLWRSFGKTEAGRPRPIAPGLFPGSVFYAAADTYALTHTCNSWTEAALRAARLPVPPENDTLAGPTLRAAFGTGQACAMTGPIPAGEGAAIRFPAAP